LHEGIYRSFGNIAERWSAIVDKPAEVILGELVKSFWRGEFENDSTTALAAILPPRDGRFRMSGSQVVEMGAGGERGDRYITAERDRCDVFRREVACALAGTPEIFPFDWDHTEAGLFGFGEIDYASWPSAMRQFHYERWVIERSAFKRWYAKWSLAPAAKIDRVWPFTPRSNTIAARTRCQEWLETEMGAEKSSKAKSEYRTEAIGRFKVSQRSFDIAWANAMSRSPHANAWRKPGPKGPRR